MPFSLDMPLPFTTTSRHRPQESVEILTVHGDRFITWNSEPNHACHANSYSLAEANDYLVPPKSDYDRIVDHLKAHHLAVIRALMARGAKVSAIQFLRAEVPAPMVGLAAAKEFVEAFPFNTIIK